MFCRRDVVIGGAAVAIFALTKSALAGDPPAATLVTVARAQVGVTTIYDPAYVELPFPGGDIPRERGVCTDVIIRAYRDAFGLDLQTLVNTDMRTAFAEYPRRWGLTGPNANIDHRRVGNLQVFLRRRGAALAYVVPAAFDSGDLVTLKLPGNLDHIGIVSDQSGPQGLPLLIHNIGQGAREKEVMHVFPLTGRFRWLPA